METTNSKHLKNFRQNDKQTLDNYFKGFRKDLAKALEGVCAEYGVKSSGIGNITYTDSEFHGKIQFDIDPKIYLSSFNLNNVKIEDISDKISAIKDSEDEFIGAVFKRKGPNAGNSRFTVLKKGDNGKYTVETQRGKKYLASKEDLLKMNRIY